MAGIFSRQGLLVLLVLALLVCNIDAAGKKSKHKKSKAVKPKKPSPPPPPPPSPPPPPKPAGMNLTFYAKTCPSYTAIVNKHVAASMKKNPTIAAGLLRMHFHDCWIRGCDASVLLNSVDGGKTQPEKLAGPNLSLRGFEVIDNIKKELESKCRGKVSCADILTSATRDAVVLAGGPFWPVPLGRKDGRISRASEVQLPSPFDDVNSLISKFAGKQLGVADLVALSGAHTIGFGQCSIFQSRLSGDATMNQTYAKQLQKQCNRSSSISVANDPVTPNRFDNQYYSNLKVRKGLFASDEGLFFASQTAGLVNRFAADSSAFAKQFSASMTKLITLPPFQSNTGGIRSTCAVAK